MPALIIIVLMLVVGTAGYKLLLNEPATKPDTPAPKAPESLSGEHKVTHLNKLALWNLLIVGGIAFLRHRFAWIEAGFGAVGLCFMALLSVMIAFALAALWLTQGQRPPLIAGVATLLMVAVTLASWLGVYS